MSFVDTLYAQCAARGERPALVEMHGASERPCPANRLLDRAARARTFLAASGIRKGDRVGLLSPNSADWAAIDLAILAHGAISVPLYARQDKEELAHMLEDCDASLLLVANEDLEEGMREAWPAACTIHRFEEAFAVEPTQAEREPLEPSDPVTIIYTSGTSGKPKGVILTAENVGFMLPATVTALGDLMGPSSGQDRVFHYLPLCFAGSRIMLWTQLYRGNPLTLSTDLNALKDELAGANPQYYLNVPALLERVRNGVVAAVRNKGGIGERLFDQGSVLHKKQLAGEALSLGDRLQLALARRLVFRKIKAQIGSRLEFLICGSAPLSEETQAWFEMLSIPVYQVYGLTETTAIVTMDKPGQVEAGKVGHPIAGCELKLNDEGELLCRGDNIFAGYWGRSEATGAAIQDGWFHTGDQAEIDASGNLRIIGRAGNLLVPESGHNVAPEPIEQRILETCERAEQAMVVGHGKPFLTAIVTGELTADELHAALGVVNGELPHYRRVRNFVLSRELFTPENGQQTANQKLKRRQILADYQEKIEELYA